MTDTHDIPDPYCDADHLQTLHDVPPHEVHLLRVDGARRVLKHDTGPTGSARFEGAVTRFVSRHTDTPVPHVRVVGDDHYLADWHDDAPSPDADSDPTDGWARAAGRGLARLHAATEGAVEGYGRPDTCDGSVVAPHDEWHAAALTAMDRRAEALERYGYADPVRRARDRLRDRPNAFGTVGASVLCHGWWSPEHVAVHDGAVARAVDFEHALAAPPEWDYLRAVLPVFEDPTPFREGYEAVRPLGDTAEAFVALAETYYLVSLFVQDEHDTAATAERAEAFTARLDDRL